MIEDMDRAVICTTCDYPSRYSFLPMRTAHVDGKSTFEHVCPKCSGGSWEELDEEASRFVSKFEDLDDKEKTIIKAIRQFNLRVEAGEFDSYRIDSVTENADGTHEVGAAASTEWIRGGFVLASMDMMKRKPILSADQRRHNPEQKAPVSAEDQGLAADEDGFVMPSGLKEAQERLEKEEKEKRKKEKADGS